MHSDQPRAVCRDGEHLFTRSPGPEKIRAWVCTSIGTEDAKGNELTLEAFKNTLAVGFRVRIGNVEGHDLFLTYVERGGVRHRLYRQRRFENFQKASLSRCFADVKTGALSEQSQTA